MTVKSHQTKDRIPPPVTLLSMFVFTRRFFHSSGCKVALLQFEMSKQRSYWELLFSIQCINVFISTLVLGVFQWKLYGRHLQSRKRSISCKNWEKSNKPLPKFCWSAEEIQVARSAQMATLRSAWPLKTGVWTWLCRVTTGLYCQSSFLPLAFGKSCCGMCYSFGFPSCCKPF